MSTYDASSIKILSVEQCMEKWDWLRLSDLSQEYSVPLSCIELGLEACNLAGVDFEYYINRYLKRLDLPQNNELTTIYRELSSKRRENQQA